MTNYSDNPRMCRVDFFKPSGKWYMTEAVEFPDTFCGYGSPNEALAAALDGRHEDMHAVCLFPYSGYDYPAFRPAKADELLPDSDSVGRPKCVPEGAHWMLTKLADGTHAVIWLGEDDDGCVWLYDLTSGKPWAFQGPEDWYGDPAIGSQAREDVIWFGRTYGDWG